jgi:hypothetical protein
MNPPARPARPAGTVGPEPADGGRSIGEAATLSAKMADQITSTTTTTDQPSKRYWG